VAKRSRTKLTKPDLVVLSMFVERPWHGYDLNQELERREVRDWAGVSRPQIYYSLNKLVTAGLLEPADTQGPAAGPERRVYRLADGGKEALSDALDNEEWATDRSPTPLNTWIALASHTSEKAIKRVLQRRRDFLAQEIAKEQATVVAIEAEGGPQAVVAATIVRFAVAEFELELSWLDRFEQALLQARSNA
jgi:DNA-binding PadR family transcriptional regulator